MAERSPGTRLAVDVLLYTLARLALAAVLTLVIFWSAKALGIGNLPLAVAVLFALVIALPLGMAVFAPLRRRVTAGIAVVDERRRSERDALHARLRGEKPSEPAETAPEDSAPEDSA